MRAVEEHGLSLDERVETDRDLVRALAFRLLGSVSGADAAVAEASRRTGDVDSLIRSTAAACLDALRSREVPEWHVPDVVVSRLTGHAADQTALLDGTVGVPLFVALDQLTPEQRVAFVLHERCGLPLGEIGAVVGTTEDGAGALVAGALERLRTVPVIDGDLAAQRKVVQAYYRAASRGDLDALRELVDETIVLRSDAGAHAFSMVATGVEAVARRMVVFNQIRARGLPALVNGAAGGVVLNHGAVICVVAMTVVGDRIAEADVLFDPNRLAAMDLSAFLTEDL
ncbi:sigma factor-like helix-turn-helix DNA-binding protein [Cellulomonas sp. McL0617]|uniref:sigma factor-like helix-turn-helix DNA-binding protein n=1 Tax=Cellulomonas sp. McL0617 TaxID=3415675 RepID=UPI003CF56151